MTILAHRQSVPVLIAVPDDPDALRLMRLIVALLDFFWQYRYTFLTAAEIICDVAAVGQAIEEGILGWWMRGVFRLVLFGWPAIGSTAGVLGVLFTGGINVIIKQEEPKHTKEPTRQEGKSGIFCRGEGDNRKNHPG